MTDSGVILKMKCFPLFLTSWYRVITNESIPCNNFIDDENTGKHSNSRPPYFLIVEFLSIENDTNRRVETTLSFLDKFDSDHRDSKFVPKWTCANQKSWTNHRCFVVHRRYIYSRKDNIGLRPGNIESCNCIALYVRFIVGKGGNR